MMDVPMDIGGGVAVKVTKHAEIAVAFIHVNAMVGNREVRKTVTISGSNIPGPHITISLSPLHCWGFDPNALTNHSRDPKFRGNVSQAKVMTTMIANEVLMPHAETT